MVRYNEELVEEVRNSNDIVDIVSQYVILKRSGRNFFGLCPFHKEKSPSFSVSPDKQIFHCFGCGAGGNVISFLSKIENISYKESIEELAERANIKLPSNDTNEDIQKQQLREKVLQINELVAKFYHENLYKSEAKQAQEYVKQRKLDNKTLKQFMIGYSRGGNDTYKFLKEKGFSDKEIETSYLAKKSYNSFIDVFKNRLMFPILDVRGRPIAFGGRVLDSSLPKYINSPDTNVYSKGRNLFGLNVAKNTEDGRIIIVEGYMDAISLHQRGIHNVVASLGTALTEQQGRLLRKYAEKIIISYDSDGAGQAATLRGLEILSNLGCDIRILQMEGAKDPDEYVIKYGNGRFNMLVEQAISLIEFKVKMLRKQFDLNNTNDKIKFLKQIAKLLTKIDSKIEQEIYIDKIAKVYSISKEALYAEVNKIQGGQNTSSKILERNIPTKKIVVNDNISNVLVKRENTIISLLINGKYKVYNQIKNKIIPEDFKSELNRRILTKIYDKFGQRSNITNILDLFEQEDEISRITEIMADDYEIGDDQKVIDKLILLYEKDRLLFRKQEIIAELKKDRKAEKNNKLEEELHVIITRLVQK